MSNPEPLLSEFLTTIELAAELGRNKRTLDRWNALGTGPPRTRMGRTVLYRRSSVQKWLAAQENQAGIVTVADGADRRPAPSGLARGDISVKQPACVNLKVRKSRRRARARSTILAGS